MSLQSVVYFEHKRINVWTCHLFGLLFSEFGLDGTDVDDPADRFSQSYGNSFALKVFKACRRRP